MPANLPPQYFEAEKRYRRARDIPERIEALEEMLSIMPKHKGTDKLRAELRSKIAKLMEASEKKPLIGRKGSAYYIRKEGAGQVVLVGLPNVGKSQLISAVTEASSAVADYPFTTQTINPGMIKYENIQIQLVDVPSIAYWDAQSWLHGVLKNADLLLIVVDLGDDALAQLEATIEGLKRLRVKPVGKEAEEEAESFIVQKKALIVANKSDLENSEANYRRLDLHCGGEFPLVSISAKERVGLEELKKEIYKALDVVRVYTKAPGTKADLDEPVVLKRGSTVADVAQSIHKDFGNQLKYAQVWGSGKFSGQKVKRDHIVEEGDVIELRI